jgi:eukaryotic-like serine/threonine-protein kinase
MKFVFGPFELDLAMRELRRDGRPVPLQPRVFRTLQYLIEHRDRVVSKQELIEALWGGYQLNAVAVPWTINRARTALSDAGLAGELIETVRGHGYRFVGALRKLDEAELQSARAAPASVAQEPLREHTERPFVGRSRTLQQLLTALSEATEERGGLCLLTGEPGIGKTRCLDEFASVVRRRGGQVWIGRCFESGVAPAFWPFIQIMRAAVSDATLPERLRNDGQALLRKLEPRRALLRDDERSAEISGDERFWLLDGLSRWLIRSAKGQARVVAIEDLQCIDETSLQALALLAPLLAQSRLLLVATARERAGDASERSASTLKTRLRPCEHMPLEGLRNEDVDSYLRIVLGSALTEPLSQLLYAKTAGNPLFLQEMTRVVAAHYERKGRIDLEDVRPSAAVTEVISARLRTLDPRTRQLLDVACVIGEEPSVAVLQRVTQLSSQQVLSGLDAALDMNIVATQPDATQYVFSHPLMREVLYADLSAATRAELHAQVALALEAVSVVDPPLHELAYHFHLAPPDTYCERAAHYGRAAGDTALAASAYDEAARYYSWALAAQSCAAPDDVAAACGLLLSDALALSLAGRRIEARQHCQRAIELASDAGLPDVLIAAAQLLRPSVWIAQVADPMALHALERALAMLPETARAARSRAYALLASLPPYSLRLTSSRELSAQAVRLAEDSNDDALRLEAERSRLYGLSGPDALDTQLRVADELLRHEQERSWRWGTDAHFARYHASMQRGDLAAVHRAINAHARLADARRLRSQRWHCERLRAQLLLNAGKLDAAEQRFRELWHEGQHIAVPFVERYYLTHRLAINFERTGKRLSADLPELPEPFPWATRLPGHITRNIQLAIELAETERATRELRSLAADGFAAISDDAYSLHGLVQLAGSAIDLGEREAAEQLRDLLAPYASLIALSSFSMSRGCVARHLGELERFLGGTQQARSYFELACEVNARSGHVLEHLRAQLGLAVCLADSRLRGERAQSRLLAARVASAAEQLGAQALASTAEALSQARTATAMASRPARRRSQPVKLERTRARVKG